MVSILFDYYLNLLRIEVSLRNKPWAHFFLCFVMSERKRNLRFVHLGLVDSADGLLSWFKQKALNRLIVLLWLRSMLPIVIENLN